VTTGNEAAMTSPVIAAFLLTPIPHNWLE